MPCADTSDLAKTFVRLTRQTRSAPTVSDALEPMALCDGNNIDNFVLLEDSRDLNRLLKQALREGDLVGDTATVDLDFHKMSFLLLETRFADLSVCQDADNGAILADAFKLAGYRFSAILGVLLRVACKSLLLRAVPVLVETTLELVRQVRCPYGGKRAQAARGFDVANSTHDNQGRSLDYSDSFDNFTLVHFCKTDISSLSIFQTS